MRQVHFFIWKVKVKYASHDSIRERKKNVFEQDFNKVKETQEAERIVLFPHPDAAGLPETIARIIIGDVSKKELIETWYFQILSMELIGEGSGFVEE